MYLKLSAKLSPKKVAIALIPGLQPEQINWDYENVYEWAYVDLPEISYSLDITRDHGMNEVADEKLDQLSDEEIENLPTAGATYIFGIDRLTDTYVHDLSDELIQRISDCVQCEVYVYPGRINTDRADPRPIGKVSPSGNPWSAPLSNKRHE